ncbi:unnamed protein product [Prorocentrum cordatum]|nr:unnamed protein product [Polarella glacialis]
MIVYPFEMNKDISALSRYFAEKDVHRCNCLTPGLIQAMLEVEEKPPTGLKVMFSGGEALPMSTCREWHRRWPHVELINNLAMTETAADVCFCRITEDVIAMDLTFAPITDGIIVWKNKFEVIDEELVVSGWNVASGYEPPTVSKSFSPLPSGEGYSYRTGDRAKWMQGKLVLMGRKDFVVKIRGHRVDLAGIEATMDGCPAVSNIAVVSFQDSVWAVVVTSDLPAAQRFAEEKLAQAHLITWLQREELPMTASGKRDRPKVKVLLEHLHVTQGLEAGGLPGGPPAGEAELRVAAAWQAVLGRTVGREEPFLQAGGHSLAAMKLAKQLGMAPAEIFAYPTVAAQAAHLSRAAVPPAVAPAPAPTASHGPAAVIGMAGRFPGADSAEVLWEALQGGKDLLSVISAEPDRVPRKGVVPDLGLDCAFWGIAKEVAAGTDPAQRVLLECAYEALEDAGFDPFHVPGRVGVVVCGGSLSHYAEDVMGIDLVECRAERPDDYFGLEIGLDKDYLATQISFRLNLHGPSETVGTACSSALVAVVRGLQMLKLGLCDYVVCGGASFSPDDPMKKVDGMVWSPDGVCRPFAEGANGTVHSDGGGLVVLTRLEGAMQRGERVYATVLGGATNNDGARKAGYSAPSHEGQVEVIRAAHADAGITGSDINYVEAHGTGTKMGDPLEVLALAEALTASSGGPLAPRSVALGSVKGNVGHMNTAAGVPGLIKATLMLHHQKMAPSLHASRPSSLIPWERTPFHLAEAATDWSGKVATVSSFGIGGTNAHVVLGAAPAPASPPTAVAPAAARRRFNRDVLVPQGAAKARRRLRAAAAGAGARAGASVAREPTAEVRGKAEPLEGFFHEVCYEKVEVSRLQPSSAAVVVEGGGPLPEGLGLPSDCVETAPQRALSAARACGGVLIFLGASDARPGRDDQSQESMLMDAVQLLNSLARAPRKDLEVFFVLRANLRYAALWGLLRVACREHPELRLRRVQFEDGAPLVLPALPQELLLRQDGGAYAPRLRPTPPPPVAAEAPAPCAQALVTGGCRGIGVKVAEWLARTGRAKSLVLVSRRPPQGEEAEAVRRLGQELPVDVRACDVAEWADVSRLPDCDLVVHCAGNVKDSLLLHTSAEDLCQVTRPKIRGGIHLKERFPGARILGFSSSSGIFGPAGQATYAAANTFLDGLMPCIQWGGWTEAGMATDLGMTPLPGERFFPLEVGLQCLGRALDALGGAGPEVCRPLCALDSDWPVYRQSAAVFAPDDALLADICPAAAPSLLGEVRAAHGDEHVQSWELVLGHAGARWRGSLQAWEVCQQHVVDGAPILPATAYVAMALEAARGALRSQHVLLTDVAFLRTMQLTTARRLVTTLVRASTGSSGTLRFSSWPVEDDAVPPTLHCTCSFSLAPAAFRGSSLAVERRLEPVEGVYQQFADAGFHYGPSFCATGFRADGTDAMCELPPLPCAPFPVHPAALDSALHLAALVHPLGYRGVPQAIGRVEAHLGASATACTAVARGRGADMEVEVLDEEDDVLCAVSGLVLASLDASPTLSTRREAWRPLAPAPRGAWLAGDAEARALALPDTTADAGAPREAVVLACRAESLEDVSACRERARRHAARERCWVVVLDSPLAEAAAAAAAEVGAQAVLGAPEQVRALSGGLGVSAPVVRAEGGQLWAQALEVADKPPPRIVPKDESFKVTLDTSRAAKGARCRLAPRRPPQAHEVEVQTSLWALNFRDVLVSVGAIDTEVAGQDLGIGGECYGRVTRVGADVVGIAEGDLVMAVPPDGMGSFANIDARWVCQAPSGMTAEEAVSGTCAYATAWLGLHWMARIQRGDSVLIHSAGGGIGLAAVHLCLRAGCTVYATASTTEKRNLVLSLGAAAAFNSRDPAAFERGVREVTGGEGVDVVLNSLSGDALVASLKLLRPFGRFIELGKRDQYENTRLGLGPFLGGLTYSAAHFDVLMLRQPNRCRQLLEEVWRDLPDLPRLPTRSFPIGQLSEALEYFSKGVHVGKVLVSIEDTPAIPALPRAVSGPPGDEVAATLRRSLSAADGPGGLVCVPSLQSLSTTAQLEGAQAIVTASGAVAALARAVCPGALCVQLARWEHLPASALDEWLSLGGSLVASEEEAGGNLREWLVEVVSEMAGPFEMDAAFESTGLDSLSLISLARRLSAKAGRGVSVADLYDHPTPQLLLDSLTGSPQAPLVRPKALCLHGFRSNRDAFAAAAAPYVSAAAGLVEWIFVNSPRRATGPADPKVPIEEAYEWWGQCGGSFETGWMGPAFDGIDETLPMVKRMAPVGVVGFSQGAAVASLVDCAWVALFSAVVPPGLHDRATPSFHCYDPAEEYAEQMEEVAVRFSSKEVCTHHAGHSIPKDDELVRRFAAFVTAACAAARGAP